MPDEDFDVQHDAPVVAAVPDAPPPTSVFSPALAALTRPPKVGDTIEHEGRTATIIGTRVRGPGDFAVIIEGGDTLSSSR